MKTVRLSVSIKDLRKQLRSVDWFIQAKPELKATASMHKNLNGLDNLLSEVKHHLLLGREVRLYRHEEDHHPKSRG